MRRWQVLGCVGMLLAGQAGAQVPYVALEQRLDPQALAEVGLTPAQLQTLNRLLRQAEAEAPAPGGVAVASAAGPGVPTPAPLFPGLDDGPITAKVTGEVGGWAPAPCSPSTTASSGRCSRAR